jgi:hypothetical protein
MNASMAVVATSTRGRLDAATGDEDRLVVLFGINYYRNRAAEEPLARKMGAQIVQTLIAETHLDLETERQQGCEQTAPQGPGLLARQ